MILGGGLPGKVGGCQLLKLKQGKQSEKDDIPQETQFLAQLKAKLLTCWTLSSAGRASALQAEGHRFEPYSVHYRESTDQ